MSYYDVMQVCEKGHQITARYKEYPEYRRDFCEKCGSPTITACPKCNEPIKGHLNRPSSSILVVAEDPVPEFCHKCGDPYPWTKADHRRKSIDDQQDDYWEAIEFVCEKFHTVAKQIQKRYDKRPSLEIKDEYDVQDLLHALLKMFFDDIRREEYTPSYAGGSARMDFLLKSPNVGIEVKKTRKELRDKDIGKQLVEDITWYRNHKNCRSLVCFIYDPEEFLSNPRGLIKDLNEESDEFSVRVYIQP